MEDLDSGDPGCPRQNNIIPCIFRLNHEGKCSFDLGRDERPTKKQAPVFPVMTADQFISHVMSTGTFEEKKAARILSKLLPGSR